MRARKRQTKNRKAASRKLAPDLKRQPFIEHAYELRRRLYYIVAVVGLTGTLIYTVQQHVVNALLKPAHGQHFIYTSPGGGIDFLFKVCLYGGLVLSTPVIVYNLLEFIAPVLTKTSKHFVVTMSLISSVLALAGIAFGYFIGLPAALHFLLHQFTTVQIKPLVTIQSYLNFVMAYMLGSALMFQLPIILICINRIKPLKPSHLFHYERWVILAAFVLSGLMNPTPNIISQLLVAGPFIAMYQVGIGVVALLNRSKYPAAVIRMMEQDSLNQANRLSLVRNAQPVNDPWLRPIRANATSGPIISDRPHETRSRRVRIIPIIQT